MAFRAAIAFSVAVLAVLLLGTVLRHLARRQGRLWPRRSGGAVLVVAAPIGLLAANAVPTRAVAVVAGAIALAVFGLIRDRYTVPPWVVAIVMVGVSVAVAQSGVRFPLGGVPVVDFVWTVVWLTLVTLAISNSGNADGQLPSLTAASTIALVALAAFGFQSAAATVFAALIGALVAFLAYNLRPASLYAGRVGALFAGFLIAGGALWVRPSIGRPGSLLVSVLIVGVALLDGLVVVLSRLRRGRRLTVRVRDHLSHRLVAAGLRPTRTIQLLTLVQLALSAIAVFVGRGVLSLGIGALAGAGLLLALTIGAMRARMRSEREPGFSWRVRLLCFAVISMAVVASVAAAASAFSSRTKLLIARDAANDAIVAATNGDSQRAEELFAVAEREFAAADRSLGSVVNLPSLVVPVVGSNMHAARELTRVGLNLARAGQDLTQQINSDDLHLVDGRVPLESVARIAPQLSNASEILASSKAAIEDLPRGYLVGEMKDGIRELTGDLSSASRNAYTAASAARIAPLVLGESAPRRYLLVVQNPAELRGTGGLVGSWGILTAENGKLHLETIDRTTRLNALAGGRKLHASAEYVNRYARFDPARNFQNANITPDFPTAAAVMADLFQQTVKAPVDGVIAVDPQGLAALLELTGPVRVPDWPAPISSANVVDVTLRDAYAAFAKTPERADFLGDVARAAIDKATAGDLGSLERLSRVLGRSAHQGHFSLWFPKSDEEQVVDEVGISGRMPAVSGDSLAVSNTNAGGNKLDYYLDRGIDYSVTVSPSADLRKAVTSGTVTVDLKNTAPPSGLPEIAAGPFDGQTDRFSYGQNRTFISVFTPLDYTGARVGDQSLGLEVAPELDRTVYSTYLDVFAQQAVQFAVDLSGIVKLDPAGWYNLTVVRQPTLRADRVTVRVQVPAGFQILDAHGLAVVDGVAQGTIALDQTRTVRVKIGPSAGSNLWDRLRAGS
ncbi:MAG: DUF4012 domain-containing protein [Acidimicrobiia bacterium]|jgi:UDP-N-acetylmuramyl pentapeptide phosphotransferase/UDP-N-acetylglucosamine-1-phosphate transferase